MKLLTHRALSESAARALTEKIRASVGDLMVLIARAWQGRAWSALGYESWADYIKGEFNHAPLSLPREERKAVVALLRGQGMSTRAIGAATGASDFTVRNDLSGARNHAPDLEADEDALAEELIAAEPRPITGLDGKTYYPATTQKDSPPRDTAHPAPSITVTCPTCGGTGKVTQQ
jgi:hypothetical protein